LPGISCYFDYLTKASGGMFMSDSERNRAQGWRHAKLDGHANEKEFAEALIADSDFIAEIQQSILEKVPTGSPAVKVDGNKQVSSILGDLTVSKVDLSIEWPGGEVANISLKKSESGQVWMVTVPRFFAAMEHHLGAKIETSVKTGISLFIGGSNLSNYEDFYASALAHNKAKLPKIAKQEEHQKRLMASSIALHYKSIWEETLDFFNDNIGLITKLSFSQGLASSAKDYADVVIYNKVLAGQNVFLIKELVESAQAEVLISPIVPGPMNGGSTLLLPTGFLQMHHPQGENLLQFHHQYKKVSIL
jgi:hypothetical protein